MTAGIAAASLNGSLWKAGIRPPYVLVGHSIAGLTIRLFVGQHPDDVAGVVLFDPTVSSFAWRFDMKEFQPAWDGATSAREVDQVTSWPDIPFEILRHDGAVYAEQGIWDSDVEEDWAAAQDEFAALTPRGTATRIPGAGHYVYRDAVAASLAAVERVLEAAGNP
jgi:pimeloyl-ACP methyl ester carboxylesterase